MLKRTFSILIISCFATTAFACNKPSKAQLQDFFLNKAQWKTFGAQLNLVFNNYQRSTLNSIKGNARIKQVCIKGNSLQVTTTKGVATVARSGRRILVMPSTGGKYTFNPASFEPSSIDKSFVIRERFPKARYKAQERALYIAPQEYHGSGAIDI